MNKRVQSSAKTSKEALQDLINAVKNTPVMPCVLCGEETNTKGILLTSDSSFGTAAGKQRCIVYGLCTKCTQNTPNLQEKVVENLKRNVQSECVLQGKSVPSA